MQVVTLFWTDFASDRMLGQRMSTTLRHYVAFATT